MFRWIFLLVAFSLFAAKEPFKKIDYRFSKEPIDVVIPCAPKDSLTLEKCLEGIKKNGKQIRRVIVVSKQQMSPNAEWFSEDLFPFSKRDVALELFHGDVLAAEEFLSSPQTRIGWILQQLLKLYAPFIIPNISSNVLVLDSDVIFLKPVRFMSKEGKPYFITGKEYYAPYFEHAARLLPGLKRVFPKHSGIAHHMLFQKPVLEDLFGQIQERHKMEPWRAICRAVDPNHIYLSSMSEYEIYFNFIHLRSDDPVINSVKWTEIASLHVLDHYQNAGYTYVACPEWFRKKHGLQD